MSRADVGLNERVLYDDDSVLVIRGDFPIGTGPFRGGKAIADAYREWLSAWGEQRVVPHEMIDLGTRIVVLAEEIATGAGSGIPVSLRRGEVVTFRGGHIDEHQVFASWEEALEEAGLPG